LTQMFLLLGIEGTEAKEVLNRLLNEPEKSKAPHELRREVAGVMGMMRLEAEVEPHAKAISRNGIFLNQHQTTTLQLDQRQQQLEISLRALGGLLASGTWNVDTLQNLLQRSPEGSAERDLYSVLLGKQYSLEIKDYSSRITELNRQLHAQQQKHDSEKREMERTHHGKLQTLEQKVETLERTHHGKLQTLEQKVETLEQKNSMLTQERDQLYNQIEQLKQQLPPDPYQRT